MTIYKTVTVTEVPCNCKNNVAVTMSHSQAVALVDVLNSVGGDKNNTPRGDLDMVLIALEKKGYNVHTHEQRFKFMDGDVYFMMRK